MIGTRGVPATYGGIEHHVEEIGARLVQRGHAVTVYCRSNYSEASPRTHRGMRLRHRPTVGSKHLDAIVHSGIGSVDALLHPYDVVHYHGLGPGLTSPLPRGLSRARVVQTVHGFDNERAKWGRVARSVLDTAAWMSARVPHATVVVSRELAAEYAARYRRPTVHIPNGVVEPAPTPALEIVGRYGLRPSGYLLFVGRLVPEKAPDLLMRAFRRLDTDLRLVIAGGTSFTADYVRTLEDLAAADPRVQLLGYVYGRQLAELYSNARAFVLPSALEGLPLTLLEAASYGTPVVASAIPPHREVLVADGPGRRLFTPGDEHDLLRALRLVVADPAGERCGAEGLRTEVLQRFCWERAVDALEAVYAGQRVAERGVRVPG